MKTLDEVINQNTHGLYYGNRVLLPFSCYILKIGIENNIIMDFSQSNKGANIFEQPDFMEIYFLDYKDLEENISEFENIKMIVVEKGKDPFDFKNHRKIALHPLEKHKLQIKELDENTIFID